MYLPGHGIVSSAGSTKLKACIAPDILDLFDMDMMYFSCPEFWLVLFSIALWCRSLGGLGYCHLRRGSTLQQLSEVNQVVSTHYLLGLFI